MRSFPTQEERQAAIGRGKFLITQIAKKFNQQNYPTIKEASSSSSEDMEGRETFLANHGRRLKKGDVLAAHQLWVNHCYNLVGRDMTAQSKTSRHAIKETGGEKNRHLGKKLGKLVAAGLIYGTTSTEKEYGDQYTQEGAKGYGYRPLTEKAYKGFKFYWTPEFLELVAQSLPEIYRVSTVKREDFPGIPLCAPSCPLSPHKETKRDSYICPLPKTVRNEVMSKGDSANAERSLEDEREDKNSLGRGNAEGENFSRESSEKSPRPRLEFSIEEMMNEKLRGAISRRLMTSGQLLLANAVLLVQMYLRQLAPLTGKTYHPKCVETAVFNAMELLARYPEAKRDHVWNEYRQAIDRVQQRMERGGGFFVVTPDKYFDPEYKANIHMHYRHYLVPFRKRREEMDEWAHMKAAAKAQEETNTDDWARTNDRYSGLAWSMKNYLTQYHTSDYRLQNANLLRWTAEIRAMIRKDGIPYQEAVEVAKWMLTSGDKGAKWWLHQSCFGVGIRSPRSFRKHFPKIQCAYIESTTGPNKSRNKYYA